MESYNYSERDENICENQLKLFLELPKKRDFENPDIQLAQNMGVFLVNNDFIQNVDVWRGSWGFKYNFENKTVYINETPMSRENYDYYIFRLGQNQETGQNLFPDFGDETNQYRFLHETSHAYQGYLMSKESNGEKYKWYDRVINHEINSVFGILFEYCYKKRREQNSGLSTWGNLPDYNNVSEPSQSAVRAIEDANELITMYLWNPKYLDIFLDYVACNIDGFNEESIRNDGLSKITQQEKNGIKQLIQKYIEEMKQNINS